MAQKTDYISNIWRDGIFGNWPPTSSEAQPDSSEATHDSVANLSPTENKVVFCTGGAGTICSAQVRALVHLGANACIIGRNVEKTESVAKDIATVRPGAKVIGIGAVDVRKFDSLKDAAERCVKELGAIDYVIAGAAGNFLASIEQLSVNAFKSVMDIDVLGSYNTLKATVPYLIESAKKHRVDAETLDPSPLGTGGRIIFVSACLHYRGTPLQAHVGVAKAGIDSLSNSVAIEYGPHGVTSNIIAPGPIESTEGLGRLMPSDLRELSRKAQPLGRFGHVRDIADATVYILSDAGSYVTGQTLVVDGANWRTSSGVGSLQYPDTVLSNQPVANVLGQKKSKL